MERSLPTFNKIEKDKLNEECGIIGIFDSSGNNSSSLLFYGLYALQHRGQESAGIASNDGNRSYHLKDRGLVLEVFDEEILEQLVGHISIGHVRCGRTIGGNKVENAQPFVIQTGGKSISMAHNGNITNAQELREELEEKGEVFASSVDSEVIARLLAKHKNGSILNSIRKTMDLIEGAYSLVIMTENELVGVRDPHALRPLCLGTLENGYVLASESCAIQAVGADFVRDLEPGEILVITKEGINSNHYRRKEKRASCIFEYVYFARPDSTIDGANVYEARKNAGIILAREHPAEADIVTAVPDSSIPVALGYSEELGIPYVEGLFKSKYVGRTFIEPDQSSRERTLKLKLTPLWRNIKGEKVVLVDDSIVRGNTSKRIVAALKKAGAAEVHVRISSPPIAHSCYYGIDTPDREQLLGATKSVEEIREFIGADSLAYLSLEGLTKSVGLREEDFCTACFSGKYPLKTRMTYKDSGVDVDEGQRAVKLMKEHVKSTYNPNVLTDLGSFGGLFSLNTDDYKEPVLVSGTDGVGTKLKIAFMMDKHDTIGQDCVAMCVNDILCQGGKPLFFLDYIATGKLIGEKVAQIVGGIAEGCKLAGSALIGGETAEMPGLYNEGEYDIAGFAVGIVDKSDVITGKNIEAGDIILALPSSGVHSNGFSLVRKLFFDTLDMKTSDYVDELGKTLGEELLTPTKIYVKSVLNLVDKINVKGICHITGGGFYENIPRILPENVDAKIDMDSWEIPPIFKLIQQKGNIEDKEMFGTFNMGVGMMIVVGEKDAEQAVRILKEAGEDAKVIGKIVEGTGQVIL